MFSGYQPCQLVKRQINQRFKNNLCPHPQGADQPQNILLYKVTVKATSHTRYNVSVARDEEWRKKAGETMGRKRAEAPYKKINQEQKIPKAFLLSRLLKETPSVQNLQFHIY
jgi:hypothetical protein